MLVVIILIVVFLIAKNVSTMTNLNFNYEVYKSLIKEAESGGNYKAKNSIGALGAYQFMPQTLNYLQERFNLQAWIDEENFLNKPELQDLYFENFVSNNMDALKLSGAESWLGVVVLSSLNPKYSGILAPVNWYGLQAASHLAGVGGVKEFFINNIDRNDGRTSVSDYLAYFSSQTN